MKAIMFPGQGAQFKGMGRNLFEKYMDETNLASKILGYDIKELCLEDPKHVLGQTQFTQPALYVVNAFRFYEIQKEMKPTYFLGHSLGEYNALLAAGAFSFEDGLRMVQKRGELMAAASGGGMVAVLGLNEEELTQKLEIGGHHGIDIANYNTPSQIVVSGKKSDITTLLKDFDQQEIKAIPLFVSAPFHSRYMKPAADEFKKFIENLNFSSLTVPVIANTTGKPYQNGEIVTYLSSQIASSVKWMDSIRFLMGKEIGEYEELGGSILTKMVNQIKEKASPLIFPENETQEIVETELVSKMINNDSLANQLGSESFRKEYNVKYSYASGSMYRGIASKELVVKMAKSNLLSFLGTGGMSFQEMNNSLDFIKSQLHKGETFGANLMYQLGKREAEMKTVKVLLNHGITVIEASAYMQLTKALVYYRLVGLTKNEKGKVQGYNRIIAKVSRPEIATLFLRPAPQKIIDQLFEDGLINEQQITWSREIAMADDICVEADSGGHTDGGVAMVLFSAIQELRNELQAEFKYIRPVRVGLAGGIGTPQAAACAFVMGADFIVTGSINQCTVESAMSDAVKDLLQDMNIQDTTYAPAGDMFEFGSKVQVMKKGVLFPARANKLYEMYKQYDGLDDIPEKIIARLEKNYFKKTIQDVWSETQVYLRKIGDVDDIEKANKNTKHKMSLVFRWYLGHSTQVALKGIMDSKSDFQIHTGPALGAFNKWVKGSKFENWQNRHVDEIGIKIMTETAVLLEKKLIEYKLNVRNTVEAKGS